VSWEAGSGAETNALEGECKRSVLEASDIIERVFPCASRGVAGEKGVGGYWPRLAGPSCRVGESTGDAVSEGKGKVADSLRV
jgi:hypothetical protein